MKEKIDQFCKNYEIQLVDDQKRRARYHPPRYFTDPLRADIISRDFVEYEKPQLGSSFRKVLKFVGAVAGSRVHRASSPIA